jgi:3-methyladenine DNA glycosylase AlkD
MTIDLAAATEFVAASLSATANPEKAVGMQAYMKTDMPFYGVQKPARVKILGELAARFPPSDRDDYESLILALWALPHREEKYLAQSVATRFGEFVVPESMPIYKRFITEGRWWDFVDEASTHMVRRLIQDHPGSSWADVDRWIDDSDIWLRRAAIICQIGLKERTDRERLFRFCEQRMDEKEFFVRKAIGWALREYAKTDPHAVAGFVSAHRDQLSGLSYREATKHIGDLLR